MNKKRKKMMLISMVGIVNTFILMGCEKKDFEYKTFGENTYISGTIENIKNYYIVLDDTESLRIGFKVATRTYNYFLDVFNQSEIKNYIVSTNLSDYLNEKDLLKKEYTIFDFENYLEIIENDDLFKNSYMKVKKKD